MPDDWRSGYRPASEDRYRQPNAPSHDQHSTHGRDYSHGSSGRAGGNGQASHGNGYGGQNSNGGQNGDGGNGHARNGYPPSRPGNGAYGPAGPAGPAGAGSGDRSVPGGRKVATGRHGGRRAADQNYDASPQDDTGAWYRPASRYGATRTGSWRTGLTGPMRRAQYSDEATRTGRGGAPGPGGPGGPGGGRRGPRRGQRDIRALIDPDGQTPLPLKILRRLWYGRWWRHWSFKKVGLLFGALCATMALVLVATFFIVLNNTKVPIMALSKPLTQSSVVYFANGKEVGCFCTAGRTVLTQAQISHSKILVAAVLAAEDRAFFTEGGISLSGLARAIKNDLSGGSIQGGSTITEQFVKRYYNPGGNGNLSYGTKIKEIFVAIKLAKMEPKWWILTHYLNAIPLGAGANGVQAAAETYFHVSAWQLSVPQAAMIGAMIQSPYGYDPLNPTADPGLGNSLLQRWIYVLGNMVRDNAISQATFNQLVPDQSNTNSKANLKNFPPIKLTSAQSDWTGYRGYIMQLVQNELASNYNINVPVAQLGNMGLHIRTTINERLMNALNSTVIQAKNMMAAEGVKLPSYVHITSVVEQPRTGKILAFYGGPGYAIKHCSWYHCNVDTILQPEPVGSSFKPYVLTTAVSQGMNVQNSVLNSHSPLCIPPDWTVPLQRQLSKQTANCHTFGYQPFKEGSEDTGSHNDSVPIATAQSNDPAFEDLIHRTTVQSVIDMASRLGVSPGDVHGLNALFGKHGAFAGSVQAALGEGSLSAVDQANTFATLVDGGIRATPHIIDSVYQNGAPRVAILPKFRAVPPAVAADADYALSFDTNASYGGTGVPNAVWDGRPMIAKTGTLGQGNNASEAWFIGAIPQYSMSVALFTNRPGGNNPEILDGLPPRPGWAGSYGGAWPATIWHAFMSGQFSGLAARPLPTPNYTGFVKWIQARPPKKKPKHCQPGQGGHKHRIFFGPGNGQCQNGGPNPKGSPSPPPTGTPSPPPSGSPTPPPSGSPTPPPSGSPTPSGPPTTAGGLAPLQVPHPRPAPGTANLIGLPALAILPTQFKRKR